MTGFLALLLRPITEGAGYLPEVVLPFGLAAVVGQPVSGVSVAGSMPVEADPVGHYMDVLLGRILVQDGDELMPVEAKMLCATGGNIGEGTELKSFAGGKAQRNGKHRQRHAGAQTADFIELPDQLLSATVALVELDDLGAVFKEYLAGVLGLPGGQFVFQAIGKAHRKRLPRANSSYHWKKR